MLEARPARECVCVCVCVQRSETSEGAECCSGACICAYVCASACKGGRQCNYDMLRLVTAAAPRNWGIAARQIRCHQPP